jgi:predicted flavoprotein YhiN
MNKIIIIGGGASALMLASLLNKNSVTIIESNPKLGAKLLISGGGKCNITNEMMGTQYYMGNSHFIEPSLDFFNQEALLIW